MIDRDALVESSTFERTERRLELCAFEVRRRDRQWQAFYEEQHRVHVVNSDPDTAAAVVFHGERKETVRERLLREHREELQAELKRKLLRHQYVVRKASGILHFCRHCNSQIIRGAPGADKCMSCKADPDLVTARGSETRSFVPRREAQPDVTPLSPGAERVLSCIEQLEPRMREAIELRYFNRQSDLDAAHTLGFSVGRFARTARAAVTLLGALLARREIAS